MTGGPISGLRRLLGRFEARVLVGLILTAGTLWAFLMLGGEMSEGETAGMDRALVLQLRTPGDLNDPIGSHGVEEAIRDLTALGGTTLVTLVTVVGVLAFAVHFALEVFGEALEFTLFALALHVQFLFRLGGVCRPWSGAGPGWFAIPAGELPLCPAVA